MDLLRQAFSFQIDAVNELTTSLHQFFRALIDQHFHFFVGFAHVLFGAFSLDRIANRPLQEGRIDFLLGQIIRCAHFYGRQIQIIIAASGEHNEWNMLAFGNRITNQFQPAAYLSTNLLDRQNNNKGRTFPNHTLSRDGSLVSLNDLLTDGQAHPGPFKFIPPVQALERAENAVKEIAAKDDPLKLFI